MTPTLRTRQPSKAPESHPVPSASFVFRLPRRSFILVSFTIHSRVTMNQDLYEDDQAGLEERDPENAIRHIKDPIHNYSALHSICLQLRSLMGEQVPVSASLAKFIDT